MVFTHSAFLYDGDATYASTLSGFVRDGLERGEAVAVAAPPSRLGLLRDTLADDAKAVRFLPADEWYVRPVRTIAGWASILRSAAEDGRPYTRLIGEIPYADRPDSWVRFEAALNRSLAELHGHLLCPYDRSHLPTAVLAAAGRTHPRLHDGDWRDSAGYESPEQVLTLTREPPWPVSGDPLVALPIAETVAELRAAVRRRAADEGWLPADRAELLALAVSELATNGIRHGGERRELRIWVLSDAVVGEIVDDGPGSPQPLAGYLLPDPTTVGGMGLWLIQQLCDSLSIHRDDGFTYARFAVRRTAPTASSPAPAWTAALPGTPSTRP
ncbi:anti-sigma factor RsbA family regulatory protein [Actinoplanes sp. NPDC049316]|uniref:anti-sigma factor RsbA family regulatory protein n=1 Tax=Actinoplanes sp. NPDC049316 TaxID=3154727 RepID=UPI003432E97C